MESTATIEDGHMVYKDKNGKDLYQRGEDTGYGIKGTILPESNRTELGGSTGFDTEQPMPIIVDPAEPTTHIKMAGRPREEEVPPVTIDSYNEEFEPVSAAARYDTPLDTYDVPPAITPERPKEPVVEGPKTPTNRIIFDLGEAIGEFECFYHRIFKDGVCLVLVWDNRYHGSRYNPSSKLREAINVYVGKERDCYKVLVGPRFTDDFRSEEYLVLFIKGDENGEER